MHVESVINAQIKLLMSAIIDGKTQSIVLVRSLAQEIAQLKSKYNIIPKLAVLLVGENPASHTYVKIKTKRAKEVGIATAVYQYDADITTETLQAVLLQLNHDPKTHGILVQMPLPKHIDSQVILSTVAPQKDVDGFSPINIGNLYYNNPSFIPCTPLGIMHLIRSVHQDISGLNAVVLGRSLIVGRPTAELLLQANCTVTILHSRSRDIAACCARGNIVVAAVGIPHIVKRDWIMPGATVIDVGINKIHTTTGTKIVGDVDFENVVNVAGHITPVPGGVGPMTVAYMLANTLKAAQLSVL